MKIDNALPCMNCKQPVAPEESKLFAEVYVCPDCYKMAVHFWLRLDKELRELQVMAKESIRVCLLEGKFNFPESVDGQDIPKRDVLESILSMEESRAGKNPICSAPTTMSIPASASTETTLPPVHSQAVPGRLSSRKDTPRS